MKLRAKLTATVAATACMLALAAPSQGGNLVDERNTLERKEYQVLFELVAPDMCNQDNDEFWLKEPERNGQYWETWCRDIDRFNDTGEKFLKRVFWRRYPNGDPRKVQYTFAYDCTDAGDIIMMDIEGVYEDGCLGSWP